MSDTVSEWMFPEWEMLDDDMPTMTWTLAQIADGAIEQARPEELRAIFKGIAEKARS